MVVGGGLDCAPRRSTKPPPSPHPHPSLPSQFYVLRQKGTEPPGSGRYNKHAEAGTYTCAGCGTPLFTSDMKFDR